MRRRNQFLQHPPLKTNGEYVQNNYRITGTGIPAIKGVMGRLTQPKTQCKNTRLEVCGHGPWVPGPMGWRISLILTNLEASVQEPGTSWDGPWGLRHLWEPSVLFQTALVIQLWQAPSWKPLSDLLAQVDMTSLDPHPPRHLYWASQPHGW